MTEDRNAPLAALADGLAAAWTAKDAIDDVAPEERPRDRAEAFAVQDRMVGLIGEATAGWKIGATSPKMRAIDGFSGIVPGRLFSSRVLIGPRQTIPPEMFPGARMEPEFAFRLKAEMPARAAAYTSGEVAGNLVLHPAIEIISNRYPRTAEWKKIDEFCTIADNGGGYGFVAGDPVPDWQDVDFGHHKVAFSVDDEPESENFLGEMRCVPLDVITDLANWLSGRGEGLKAGDFVTTGAAAVPRDLKPKCHVVADFGRLGRLDIDFG